MAAGVQGKPRFEKDQEKRKEHLQNGPDAKL